MSVPKNYNVEDFSTGLLERQLKLAIEREEYEWAGKIHNELKKRNHE